MYTVLVLQTCNWTISKRQARSSKLISHRSIRLIDDSRTRPLLHHALLQLLESSYRPSSSTTRTDRIPISHASCDSPLSPTVVCRRTRYLFALPRCTGYRRPTKTTPEPDVNCEIVSRSDTSTLPPSLIFRLRSQISSICCMHLPSISSLIICLFAIFTNHTRARTIVHQDSVAFARAMLEIIGLDQH